MKTDNLLAIKIPKNTSLYPDPAVSSLFPYDRQNVKFSVDAHTSSLLENCLNYYMFRPPSGKANKSRSGNNTAKAVLVWTKSCPYSM